MRRKVRSWLAACVAGCAVAAMVCVLPAVGRADDSGKPASGAPKHHGSGGQFHGKPGGSGSHGHHHRVGAKKGHKVLGQKPGGSGAPQNGAKK